MVFGNGVKNIQAAAYNGAPTVVTSCLLCLLSRRSQCPRLIILTLTGNFTSAIHEACELGMAILPDSTCQIAKPSTKSNLMCILCFDFKRFRP